MSSAVVTAGPSLLESKGRVGVLLLILSEIAFFGVLIVAHLFYLGKNLVGPLPGEVLHFPVFATIALLTSSGTIVLAVRDLRQGHVARFTTALFATILLGATFLGLTAVEWSGLIQDHGLTIRTNLFGTTFYTLVGFHAGHVTLGVSIMLLTGVLSLLGHVRARDAERLELVSWYWHFVDAVWIAVLLVVYVIGV